MSKLAHSNDETMEEIERRAREQDDKRYARAKVLGVGRDAENVKTLVVIFDQVPSDDDLRRTHDLLRSNAEVSGAGTASAGLPG